MFFAIFAAKHQRENTSIKSNKIDLVRNLLANQAFDSLTECSSFRIDRYEIYVD